MGFIRRGNAKPRFKQEENMKEAKLGDKVEDTVSGYKGICVSITDFINGCKRISIQPKIKKDGSLPDDKWFDIEQVKVLKSKVVKTLAPSGGPMPHEVRRNFTR